MNLFKKLFSIIKRQATSTIIAITGGNTVAWPPKDYDNFVKESYMKNVIAFRCMDYIAKSVASVPWKIFKDVGEDQREIDDQHPMNKIFDRPNPDESWAFLMIQFIVYLLVSGNSFTQRIKIDSSGELKELYILRPDKIKLEKDKQGKIAAYLYNNGAQRFEVDPITRQADCLQVKLFHPTDADWGLSITEPTSREIDTSNESTEWQMRMMQNEGRPGMIVTVVGTLSKEQYTRLEQNLKSMYSGSKNAGKNLILENDEKVSAVPYSWKPKEMDWIESNRELSRKICLGYGVPPMLLGIPGDNTYSNYQEARQAFWEETVIFYLDLVKGEYNNWIFTDEEKLYMDYVLDKIPALAPKRSMLWKRAQESDFLTINEKRELAGYEAVDGGDIILVPSTQLPLETVSEGEEGDEEDDDEDKRIQDLMDQGFTEDEALAILDMPEKACGMPDEEKPFANEYSCRLKDPKQFDKFRRKNNAAGVDGKPIDFIFGIKGGKSALQAIRYRKKYWTKSSAKSHCLKRDHILFE